MGWKEGKKMRRERKVGIGKGGYVKGRRREGIHIEGEREITGKGKDRGDERRENKEKERGRRRKSKQGEMEEG